MTHPAVTPIPPAPPFLGYRAGAWYGVDSGGAVTSGALLSDTAYAFPIFLEQASTLGRIAMMVGTSVPAVNGQLALYASRRDTPAPGRLLAGSLTAYDMGAPANTVHELIFATPLRLSRGFYWGAARFDGAAQPRTAPVGLATGIAATLFQALLGANSVLAVYNNNPANPFARITGTSPYAAPWPDDFGAPTFGLGSPGSPTIAWRIN